MALNKKELTKKAMTATVLINKILENANLFIAYNEDNTKIIFVDRDDYKKGNYKTAKVSIGALNAKVESNKELSDMLL